MTPRRKRQRLSEDGAEAVTATANVEENDTSNAATAVDEKVHKENLAQRRTLFVRSLAATTTTEDLTEHFSESYPIKHAVAVLDSTTKQCKGYGFVTFADAEDAQRAVEELDKSELKGKKIRVEVAEPRHRDIDSDISGQKKSIPSTAVAKAKAEREQQRKEQQPPRLIVRNLPWSIKTPDQLGKLFLSYGKVKTVQLPKTHTGQLKGFGFVLLRGRKNAEKAMEGLNGKEVDGRTLAVDWAVDKDTWQNLQSAAGDGEAKAGDGEADSEEGSVDEDAESSELEEDSDSDEDDEEDSDDDHGEESEDDEEEISDDEEGGIDIKTEQNPRKPDLAPNTLFIRNLPFTATDETLEEHMSQFGPLRYARVVIDHETERPKGTGFACFVNEQDAIECLRNVPRTRIQQRTADKKDGSQITFSHSVLEDEDADPTGKYTMEGRVLQLSRAVDKNEAARLTADGAASRFSRDKDKRRLYLLSEGTISADSPLHSQLAPSEVQLRENSAKQRQKLIQSNPSLHLSLTRLSVRNIPRSITSKDLKALARQAIVGFAKDVTAGKRQKLSKEELARGGEEMVIAEKIRKKRGKGLVKQAKIVFETNEGSKVAEDSGAGRSRGYGFIEYYTHRNALMGLRYLNGHAVDYKVKGELPKGKKAAKEALEDRKKRLIVEFAIENANVVNRRTDREVKAREPAKVGANGEAEAGAGAGAHQKGGNAGKKRKRDDAASETGRGSGKQKAMKGAKGAAAGTSASGKRSGQGSGADADGASGGGETVDTKVAQRERIIRKKRMARRARKAGKA